MIRNPAERRIYLYPGEFVTLTEACTVTTILGSCVAVCLWDEVRGFAGMTHFILPHEVGNGLSSPRFGNVAIRLVLESLESLGSGRRGLTAKLFGGAAVHGPPPGGASTLGERNVAAARDALARAGIPVVAEDVGGSRGRKIFFETGEGSVWLKLLGGA